MPDTIRSYRAFQDPSTGLFKDNEIEAITAQDLRDFVVSVYGARFVVAKSADYTVQAGDEVVLVDSSAGDVTISLPAVATSKHLSVLVIKVDASVNLVVLDGSAAETINGQTTLVMASQYDGARVYCDASGWLVGGRVVGEKKAVSYTLRASTSDDTPTKLTVEGGQSIGPLDGQSMTFRASVIGRGPATSYGFSFEGLIENRSGTALVGSPLKSVFAAACDAEVTANDGLKVIVTGLAATMIQWAARVDVIAVF